MSLAASCHILLAATPMLEANNIRELIALAKNSPLPYAIPGTGTSMHLAAELLESLAGVDMAHVPYKGGSAACPGVIVGRVPLLFASIGHIKAGRMKVIAITSSEPGTSNPEIGTIAEAVPGFDEKSGSGGVVPETTPREIVCKSSADIGRVLAMADVKNRIAEVGMKPAATAPEAVDSFMRREIERWAPVIKASGAKAAD